jgi:ubiquinone/menaquinone biosynthesis C-methylase UbiE
MKSEEKDYAESAWQFYKQGHYRDYLLQVPELQNCKKILDVGCGPGSWLYSLAEEVNYEVLIAGDISLSWLEFVRENFQMIKKPVFLVELDAICLPIKSNFCDLIICALVMPLVRNEYKLCDEIIRVLAPKGNGIILFHSYRYYIRRLLTKDLKIKLSSIMSMVSSMIYQVTNIKVYNSTFQTYKSLKRYFNHNRCSVYFTDTSESGITSIFFRKD